MKVKVSKLTLTSINFICALLVTQTYLELLLLLPLSLCFEPPACCFLSSFSLVDDFRVEELLCLPDWPDFPSFFGFSIALNFKIINCLLKLLRLDVRLFNFSQFIFNDIHPEPHIVAILLQCNRHLFHYEV